MDNGLALDKLAPALVALQADLKPVEKSAANPFFKSKYAPLPAVMQVVQPLLARHKLAVSQFVTHLDGQSALRTLLIHESGQLLEDTQPLLLPQTHEEDKWDRDAQQLVTRFVVPTPQDQGSAITYARRYGVMAVLGLVADEDDDGNAASAHTGSYRVTSSAPVASSTKPASDKQKSMIAALAHKVGKDNEWIDNVMAKTVSSADASAVIEKLQALEGDAPTERQWK